MSYWMGTLNGDSVLPVLSKIIGGNGRVDSNGEHSRAPKVLFLFFYLFTYFVPKFKKKSLQIIRNAIRHITFQMIRCRVSSLP